MSVKVVCFAICLLPVLVLTLERGDYCKTPNNESARCIPFRECNVILYAVSTREPSAIQFAKSSQCGYDTHPLVCCGTTAKLEPVVSKCITPNGEEALCVRLSSCKIIFDAINTRNKDAQDFAKKSRCDLSDLSKVCCGSDAYPLRTNLLPDRSSCGEEKYEDSLFELREFPWTALLRYKKVDGTDGGFRCGGTVINKRYILTAAHCVDVVKSKGISLDSVRLGEWRISTKQDCDEESPNPECADPVVDLKIEDKIVHQNYEIISGKNDIALLRLERNVQFTDFIQPICLPVRESVLPEPGTAMAAVGWGITENNTNSDYKLKVKLPIVSKDVCNLKIRKRGGVSEGQICAGTEFGIDYCRGDSGGPLMDLFSKNLDRKPQWYQEGIASWDVNCGLKGYPGIYTRVANYMDWIIENLKTF